MVAFNGQAHANLCIIHVKLLKRPVISIDHDWPGDLRAYDRDHPDHPDHPGDSGPTKIAAVAAKSLLVVPVEISLQSELLILKFLS